jgi:hypothetical protein
MTRYTKIAWLLIAFALLSLVACGGKQPVSPTADSNLVYTQIWQTVEAVQTQTALAMPPEPTVTNTPEISLTPKPTNTPLITSTPLVSEASSTPLVLPTAAGTSQSVCDNYQFVADVTYPDGTVVSPGTPIIKTWSIKNLGPCTWNQDYSIVFGWGGDGTDWKGTKAVSFSKVVLPGEILEISVSLAIPTQAGDYGASFRLQNDDNFNFGDTLTIFIKVK